MTVIDARNLTASQKPQNETQEVEEPVQGSLKDLTEQWSRPDRNEFAVFARVEASRVEDLLTRPDGQRLLAATYDLGNGDTVQFSRAESGDYVVSVNVLGYTKTEHFTIDSCSGEILSQDVFGPAAILGFSVGPHQAIAKAEESGEAVHSKEVTAIDPRLPPCVS